MGGEKYEEKREKELEGNDGEENNAVNGGKKRVCRKDRGDGDGGKGTRKKKNVRKAELNMKERL